MVENCGNCAFNVGLHCRRHAPIVWHGVVGVKSTQIGAGPLGTMEDIKGPVTAWPMVAPTDFCGDFELKDAA